MISDKEGRRFKDMVARDVLQDILCGAPELNGWELESGCLDKETTELTGWVRNREGERAQIRVSLWQVIHNLREKIKEREDDE